VCCIKSEKCVSGESSAHILQRRALTISKAYWPKPHLDVVPQSRHDARPTERVLDLFSQREIAHSLTHRGRSGPRATFSTHREQRCLARCAKEESAARFRTNTSLRWVLLNGLGMTVHCFAARTQNKIMFALEELLNRGDAQKLFHAVGKRRVEKRESALCNQQGKRERNECRVSG